MRTTRAPDVRIAELFPELAGRERVTVRLHPRLGPEPRWDESKLGGRLRWPMTEPWPRCDLPHTFFDPTDSFRMSERPPDSRPYVGVLQVTREDVPELEHPPRTDVFQLLWCPTTHPDLYAAAIRVFWWSASDLSPVVPPAAQPSLDSDTYIPRPCVLHPERVAEYPGFDELEPPLRARIGAWEMAEGEPRYQWSLSAAPGTKIGGYPQWPRIRSPSIARQATRWTIS